MAAIRAHLAEHRSHIAGCGVAAVFVAAAIISSIPLLAALGALICGAMMVWMTVSMSKHQHVQRRLDSTADELPVRYPDETSARPSQRI